jgi:hypothetical protein
VCLLTACSAPQMPDPRERVRGFAQAAEQGDADALYAMMTSEAQQVYGREGVRRLVHESRAELGQRGKSLAGASLQAEARAELVYQDGEMAVLALENGQFRVGAAGTLPAGATTPSQALAELRRALARRSYPGLLPVLTHASQQHLEDQLGSLVRALEHPDALDISVQGDRANVALPEGHEVTLRRERGVWKVEDFR